MGCCLSKEKHIDYVPLAHNQNTLSTITEVSQETEYTSEIEPIHI